MKRFFALLLLLPAIAIAKPVSFDLGAVPLITFAQATFKSIMGRDYVISPELVSLDRKITISVKTIDSADVPQFVEKLLSREGISVTRRDGVYYLDQVKPSAQENSLFSPEKSPAKTIVQASESIANSVVNHTGAADSSQVIDADFESRVYKPLNRPADFIVNVVNAGFGQKPATLAGRSVIISAPKKKLDRIFSLIADLDTLPSIVDVSASWIEVTQTKGVGRGISLMASVLGAKLGISFGSVNSGSALSVTSASFQAVIDVLNTDSRFKQVSTSRVIGDDYEKLNLTVGDETPTISSTGKDNAGNAVQNIVYRPSGVIVDVTPRVLGAGKINLVVDGQISSFKATTTGVLVSPTLIKRQMKTVVTVNDGEVLLIGGLNDAKKSDSVSSLPFLPSSWTAESSSDSGTDLVLVLSAKTSQTTKQ